MQTQWMDIDYMYNRWIQTLDPDRFAAQKTSYVIENVHERDQNFIVMVREGYRAG
jgi:alpha-glucosidase